MANKPKKKEYICSAGKFSSREAAILFYRNKMDEHVSIAKLQTRKYQRIIKYIEDDTSQ